MADLRLMHYRPRRQVVVPATPAIQPSLPIIDAHNHLGTWLTGEWTVPEPSALVDLMDELGIETIVNLDGRWSSELEANLDRYDRRFPGRFASFAQCNWSALAERSAAVAARGLADDLRAGLRSGARGLKVWKDLGLHVRDGAGELVLPDDPRLDELFEVAAEASVPVFIHTADPVAFFDPLDAGNERLEQLLAFPEWSFADRSRFPSFAQLMEALEARVERSAATTIVGVHMGCWAENLAEVGRMLGQYSNYHVDIAARLAELGRQPRATAALVSRFSDRVLFGTDAFPPDRSVYVDHARFLETEDECYDHDTEAPSLMGRWTISALGLDEEVLRSVYADNARRVLSAGSTRK